MPTDWGLRLTGRFTGSSEVDAVEVPMREQRNRATSCVVVEEDVVLLAGGNPRTRDALHERGVEVHEMDLCEIQKAGGGLKGQVLPLERS